jgi:hypothetical protein
MTLQVKTLRVFITPKYTKINKTKVFEDAIFTRTVSEVHESCLKCRNYEQREREREKDTETVNKKRTAIGSPAGNEHVDSFSTKIWVFRQGVLRHSTPNKNCQDHI